MRWLFLKTLLLLAVGALMVLPAVNGQASHKAPEEKKAPAEGEPAKAAEGEAAPAEGAGEGQPASNYALGPALGGRFDVSTLRSLERVARYRFPFKNLEQVITTADYSWKIHLSCALEFGSESGMAELEHDQVAIQNDLRAVIRNSRPEELLTASGKIRLKEEIIRALNRRLTTARVRQVYLTEFWLLRSVNY